MQCPRCGDNTPGTLSGCARCGAPVDRRPDPQAPPGPQAGGTGQSPLSLDATMLDPLSDPLGAPLPAPPPSTAPAPPAPWAMEMTRVEPLNGAGFMGLPHGAAPLSAPTPSSTVDPEDTQAWTLPPEDDEPESPSASSGPQAAGVPAPPPVPSWAGGGTDPSGGPIVPDSWFAEPRPPSNETSGEQTRLAPPEASGAGAAGTEVWAPGGQAGPSWGPPPPASPPGGAAPGGFGAPPADATWQMQPGLPGPQDGGRPGAEGYAGAEGYPPPNGGYPGPAGAYHPDGGYPGPNGAYPGPDGMYPGPDGAYPGPESGYPPGHRRPGGRSNRTLAIVVGVLVTVALFAVGIVMWPDGGGKSAAGASASATPRNASQKTPTKKKPVSAATRQQAQAVNELLEASAGTRNRLGRALNAAAKCEGLPTAIAGFQRVAQRRTNQINRTTALKVSRLRNGEQMRASLLKAFQLSLQTDQAFLAWAQAAQQGCNGTPQRDANYARGNALSAQATVAKKQFTVLWNPVARDVGLPARTDRQF